MYEKTHARFSLEEWLSKGVKSTLHAGIKKLIEMLNNGDSVVLDDCNPTEKARTALIASLRKQANEFILEGIEFRPKGGVIQSKVAAEFASAQEAEEIETLMSKKSIELDSDDASAEESSDEDGDIQSRLGQLLGSERAQLNHLRQSTLEVWFY